jgi:hypothetical protein
VKDRTPGFDTTRSCSRARTIGRLTGSTPTIRRSVGRTNISKDTKALTGSPDKAKNGVRSGPIAPKPCAWPGCIATLSK